MTSFRIAAAIAALIPLGGCDRMAGLAGGHAEGNEAATNAAIAAANESAESGNARPPADAGLTSSRSLTGLSGNGGGKDPVAVAAGSGATVDPRRLLGRWADDDACKTHVTLRPDGTFLSYTGGEGTWTVDGDRLALTGAEGTFALRVRSIDGDIMTVINSDGSIGRSRRC